MLNGSKACFFPLSFPDDLRGSLFYSFFLFRYIHVCEKYYLCSLWYSILNERFFWNVCCLTFVNYLMLFTSGILKSFGNLTVTCQILLLFFDCQNIRHRCFMGWDICSTSPSPSLFHCPLPLYLCRAARWTDIYLKQDEMKPQFYIATRWRYYPII